MIVVNGLGLALQYHFPAGPVVTVLVCELFSNEMQDVLRYYTDRYGRAVITEPRPQARCAAA